MCSFFGRNIILSNPKKRNALSLAMLRSLHSDLLHEADSPDLKVIIISGAPLGGATSNSVAPQSLSHSLSLAG